MTDCIKQKRLDNLKVAKSLLQMTKSTSEIIYKKLKRKERPKFLHFIEKTGMCKILFYFLFNLLATYLREKKLSFYIAKRKEKRWYQRKLIN